MVAQVPGWQFRGAEMFLQAGFGIAGLFKERTETSGVFA